MSTEYQYWTYTLFKKMLNRYFFASTFIAYSFVLDIACGKGYGSLYMAKNGAQFLVGCDISKKYCVEAKKASRNYKNCEFVVGDARKLPFKNGAFDVVVSIDTIEHLDDYNSFLSECTRIMKRDSTMICSTPNRKATSMLFKKPLNPSHAKEFYVTELACLLQRHFNHTSLYAQEYSLTFVVIMKQLRDKFMNLISSLIRRKRPGEFTEAFAECARYLMREEPKMETVHYNSYERFADKKYGVTVFKDGVLHTPNTIVCVARKKS